MIARAVNAAADVIHRAQVNGTVTATGLAVALDSARLLMSPEEAARTAAVEAERDALKARVAELEALKPAPIQTCRVCGAGYSYGEPCSTCEFRARMAAETQALRDRPGEFDEVLRHRYRVGHDLPELGEFLVVRGLVTVGKHSTEAAARKACEAELRLMRPEARPYWVTDEAELPAGAVAVLWASVDLRVSETGIQVRRPGAGA